MPFINDQLANNEEVNRRERLAKKTAARTSRFTFEPEAVLNLLKHRVIGQDALLKAMHDLLYVLKADITEPGRPLSVNLFLGPTGVGKTETVRQLAQGLLGDADALCRIDMNTLAQEHYSAAITGAPPGYVGSKEGHTLFNTDAIEGSFSRPGIVLFDEIEKASPEVIRSLLNIFDSGILRLAGGTKTISFRNCIIFMTSNLGAQALINHQQQKSFLTSLLTPFLTTIKNTPHKNAWSVVEPILKKTFEPEFINRIERKIIFNKLDNTLVDKLINLEVDKLNARLEKKNALVKLDDSARKQLSRYYNDEYGARNVAHQIRLHLNPAIAKALILQPEQSTFNVIFRGAQFCII